MSELARIGVALESDLLEEFDRLIERRGYSSRSEAFRDMIRGELNQMQVSSPEQHVIGTLTIIYDHNVRQLSEKLTGMQHEHHHEIVSTLHVHLDHDRCLEVLVLRGRAVGVQQIADRLVATKGVMQGRLTLAAADPEHAHPHH
ncbi:MAG TPA: nickel-responsive transcriptional regulator NikR [Bryobacteraceae bacterium]|jgi:CopG family nickel-responsive transcriptional regulator